MKVAFIAGPFRGKNSWEVEQNIRRAEEIAFQVAKLGVMPLCPHTNTRFFDGTLTDEFWLAGTSGLLERCDIVVMVNRYASIHSSGTKAELKLARKKGIPVFFDLDELKDFLK